MTKHSLGFKNHEWNTKRKKLNIKEIVNLYNSGIGSVSIAKKYGVSYRTILVRLKEAKIKLRSASDSARKYELNHSYFNIINSSKKAYILGLLFADGYNQHDKKSVTLQLSDPDQYILSLIGNEIYKNKDFKLVERKHLKYKTQYSLRIYSNIISESLLNLGCVQRKSLVLRFPVIPEKYYSHFIRGYFDGDGCISIGKRSQQVTFLGTFEFLDKIQDILVKECNLNKAKPFKRNNIYSVCYSGKFNCIKISKFLYKNSGKWKLLRKFKKFNLLKENKNGLAKGSLQD